MSAGHIRRARQEVLGAEVRRGRDPATGRRKIRYASFKGTKRAGAGRACRLIAAVGDGTYVEPSKLTVAEHVRARVDHWEASEAISARTAQRYRQLLDGQIRPHIGARLVQKLSTVDVEKWHATLRTDGRRRGKGGVAPRTMVHAHRVLSHALDDAMRHGVVPRNVAKLQPPPRVQASEMAILDRDGIDTIVTKLPGHEMYAPAIVALFTGMRLGEILALRWPTRRPRRQGDPGARGPGGDQGARHPVKPPKTARRTTRHRPAHDRGRRAARASPAAARAAHGARRRQAARSTRWCSRPSREASRRPAMPLGHGGSSPMVSGCRRSPSTACATRTHRS